MWPGRLSDVLRRPPLRLTLAATATAVALSGCATFSNTGEVADVDGTSISADRFEELSAVYFERSDIFGTTPESDGHVDAEQSRFLLAAMVRQQLFRNFTDREGVDVTPMRDDFKTDVLVPSPIGQADLPEAFLDLIADIDPQLLSEVVQQASAPNIDELRAMYADSPASTGLACVRQILVGSKAEADDVLDELADGADFTTLATERSIDPGAADTGGAIEEPDSACVSLQIAVQGFDPALTGLILEAQEGTPSIAIEGTRGWHIVMARPWDEVAADVGAVHQTEESGSLLLTGYIATARVDVDPRYGTWNPLASAIEEIG